MKEQGAVLEAWKALQKRLMYFQQPKQNGYIPYIKNKLE